MVVDLALSTGLRVSEIAALTIANFDYKRLTITVTRMQRREKIPGQTVPGDDGVLEQAYRPKRVPESLAIDNALADHLIEYVANQRKHNAGGRLLIGKQGPLTAQGLQRVWKSAVKRAGLPKELSIHCGRHSLATALYNSTHIESLTRLNARLVQLQLGHASVAVTL